MFKYEKVYPEYLWGHYGEHMPQHQVPDHLWLKTLDIFSEWYEPVETLHGRNLIMHSHFETNPKRHLLKLKDQYRDKMIKKGYSLDP